MNTKTENILIIERTQKSPYVYMNPREGKILFKGRVIPDNSIEFFKPIVSYLSENFTSSETIHAHFQFEYFNSSAGKEILDTFKKLEAIHRRIGVHVLWYYHEDDEEVLEAGKDYESIIRIPFKFMEYDSSDFDIIKLQLPQSE